MGTIIIGAIAILFIVASIVYTIGSRGKGACPQHICAAVAKYCDLRLTRAQLGDNI